eukprot:scaffold2601_cov127-Skeletonema_dohrnii-CCMP3373.AAC.7
MNDNNSSPTKKRKANDGRAATDGSHDVHTSNNNDGGGYFSSWFGYFSGQSDGASSGPPSNEQLIQQSLSKMDRMEQLMMRMEEKLATVSSLESRCERLEAKCSSLETILESTSQSTKEHIDRKFNNLYLHLEKECSSLENRLETKVDTVHVKLDRSLKFHDYNEMLMKNQHWKYSAIVHSMDESIYDGHSEYTVELLVDDAQRLKSITTTMRKGEFSDISYGNEKGVLVEMNNNDPPVYSDVANNIMFPHWKEFAAALKQFTPAINSLPDDCESFFTLRNVQLNRDAMLLVKEALIGKPFQRLAFMSIGNENGAGISIDAILDIVQSNKLLRKLEIGRNLIGSDHIDRLCSAVHTHGLVELDLFLSLAPGIGDRMLDSLLRIDDLKLENLYMSVNNITSAVSTLLADFLATNPRLKELNLDGNYFDDSDAALIANALRSNTTLRQLRLDANEISEAGEESLRLAMYDESSLNAAADSNHICAVETDFIGIDDYNSHEQGQINRGWKIYSVLSTRNETMSNVQHFDDIDVKIMPNILEAVQTYATNVDDSKVKPLSIVYEIMRKWDKVFSLYKTKEDN